MLCGTFRPPVTTVPAASVTLSNSPIVRDVLGNGLRILTERMTQVRSVSIGVWLTRGSRHESGRTRRHRSLSRAHAVQRHRDAVCRRHRPGDRFDWRSTRRVHREECASYYIKVLDEHLPIAIDILADIVRNPAFAAEDIEREKKVVVEEIKMVEDTPDDLVHEIFTQGFPGKTIRLDVRFSGTRETVESFSAELLRE